MQAAPVALAPLPSRHQRHYYLPVQALPTDIDLHSIIQPQRPQRPQQPLSPIFQMINLTTMTHTSHDYRNRTIAIPPGALRALLALVPVI